MKHLKPAAFALLGALAFAAPAFAAGEGVMMKNDTGMIMGMDGRMTTVPMEDKAMSTMFMKEGRVVGSNQVFMMSGGKIYMMEDRKMPDGRWLSEHITPKS